MPKSVKVGEFYKRQVSCFISWSLHNKFT